MESQEINRLTVILIENGKTGKWLAEQIGKMMQPSLDTLVRLRIF